MEPFPIDWSGKGELRKMNEKLRIQKLMRIRSSINSQSSIPWPELVEGSIRS
jgi:hypothetical protein